MKTLSPTWHNTHSWILQSFPDVSCFFFPFLLNFAMFGQICLIFTPILCVWVRAMGILRDNQRWGKILKWLKPPHLDAELMATINISHILTCHQTSSGQTFKASQKPSFTSCVHTFMITTWLYSFNDAYFELSLSHSPSHSIPYHHNKSSFKMPYFPKSEIKSTYHWLASLHVIFSWEMTFWWPFFLKMLGTLLRTKQLSIYWTNYWGSKQ